jgi:iron complex transport system ATP-binding protein
VLACDQLSFRFPGAERPVIEGVDLEIGAGELVCVVGANGAGKTTLLRLIAGLLSPSGGRVRCFEVDPAASARGDIARRVAYLPQNYQLAFPFTVREVVLFGRYSHGRRGFAGYRTNAADREAADAALARCDLESLAERRWDELSGGEQRRALMAQAFCQDVDLLLLDEPTAALDPAHALAVFEALRERVAERGAAVAITHDLNLAARYASRLVLIDQRRIAADGNAADVLGGEAARAAFRVQLHLGELPGSGEVFVVPG